MRLSHFTISTLLLLASSSCSRELYHDTPSSDEKVNMFNSPYHLLRIFGDFSSRQTNFFKENYEGKVRRIEARLILPRFSEMAGTPLLPDPFFVANCNDLKVLEKLEGEDRIDYGGGLEWRPFRKMDSLDGSSLEWMKDLRFYGMYLETKYTQEGQDWRPHRDVRGGVELYREYNLYSKDSLYWGEFWGDASWRKTNFSYTRDYQSWTFAMVPKVGLLLLPTGNFAVMPYVTGELSVTERPDFWQNRALTGVGIRLMPFRFSKYEFLKSLKVYAEELWVTDYLKEAPDPSLKVPDKDFRAGITFSINW